MEELKGIIYNIAGETMSVEQYEFEQFIDALFPESFSFTDWLVEMGWIKYSEYEYRYHKNFRIFLDGNGKRFEYSAFEYAAGYSIKIPQSPLVAYLSFEEKELPMKG